MTFSDYSFDFIRLYKANGSIQRNTLVGYNCYLKKHLAPFFGEMDVSDIATKDIQEYINRKSKTLAAKTIKEHLDLLSQIFDSAVEDGLTYRNPCLSKRIKSGWKTKCLS